MHAGIIAARPPVDLPEGVKRWPACAKTLTRVAHAVTPVVVASTTRHATARALGNFGMFEHAWHIGACHREIRFGAS